MSLRPLLEIALANERVIALARELGRDRQDPLEAHVSSSLRPYLLAALLSSPELATGAPALLVTPDDRSARDLAADLRAPFAPRRVVTTPREESAISPISPRRRIWPGLRIAALSGLASAAPVVVASAVALAEAVPDRELWPEGFSLGRRGHRSLRRR